MKYPSGGLLGPYIESPGVYKCPAGLESAANGARVRSISMNTQHVWGELPASYHNGAAGFSFAESRAQIYPWVNASAVRPVRYDVWPGGLLVTPPNAQDWTWIH